jgi:hypothetical protein
MTERLTDAEIAAALDLCARATSGPTQIDWHNLRLLRGGSVVASLHPMRDARACDGGRDEAVDAELEALAMARDILPRALGEIRRTRAMASERHEEAVRVAMGGCDATE